MLFGGSRQDIGIDLGTANTLIYVKGQGVVLDEPSVIAYDRKLKTVTAVGLEASQMIGTAPPYIDVIRPLKDGVISDFKMTAMMLKSFLSPIIGEPGAFSRIRVVIGVPSGVTEVEKMAVEDVARKLGAKEVYILEEPMAAAIGAGLDVDGSEGCMVADIGGGTTDVAVIALGGLVSSRSVRAAGDRMNQEVIDYIRKVYGLVIGEKAAENAKISIGAAFIDPKDSEDIRRMEISGRDFVTGMPKTIEISSRDIARAVEPTVSEIVRTVKTALETTPPDLAADIICRGITLCGGGALMPGLDRLIWKETGVETVSAENALDAVVDGTGISLDDMSTINRHVRAEKQYRDAVSAELYSM